MPRLLPPVKTQVSLEAFLEFELSAPQRHEMVDGQIFAMAGGTRRHNRIAVRLGTVLENASQDTGCRVAIADTLVLANSTPYYPDVMLYCHDEDDTRIVKKPCLLVEVTSESTRDIDRVEKWFNYQALESLQIYILLEQDTVRAEVFRRTEQGWLYEKLESGSVQIPCINTTVKLEEIYSRLD